MAKKPTKKIKNIEKVVQQTTYLGCPECLNVSVLSAGYNPPATCPACGATSEMRGPNVNPLISANPTNCTGVILSNFAICLAQKQLNGWGKVVS